MTGPAPAVRRRGKPPRLTVTTACPAALTSAVRNGNCVQNDDAPTPGTPAVRWDSSLPHAVASAGVPKRSSIESLSTPTSANNHEER
jgi:hypothetical protein